MRKRLIGSDGSGHTTGESEWIDLHRYARVELTSEDPAHPVESALQLADAPGWRAAAPGRQTIRLHFDQPLRIRRVHLVFREHAVARTHEFLLRWTGADGASREILRQQYTFSPPGTTTETEDYTVDLDGVASIEIVIEPDVHGSSAHASLARWLLA